MSDVKETPISSLDMTGITGVSALAIGLAYEIGPVNIDGNTTAFGMVIWWFLLLFGLTFFTMTLTAFWLWIQDRKEKNSRHT